MSLDLATYSLIDSMCQDMPALAGIAVHCERLEALHVELQAPLRNNRNDKFTAFAGSLSALGMLSGWALSQQVGISVSPNAQCAVFDARTRFRLPVRHDLIARCSCTEEQRQALADQLTLNKRARWSLSIEVGSKDEPRAVIIDAQYALWVSQVGDDES